MVTIPVLVDDVKSLAQWPLTRMTYFSIACDAPVPGSLRGKRVRRIPFLLLGNAGLIYKPLGRPLDWSRRFRSAERVRRLFTAIEERDGMFVDLDDFWIPGAALERDGGKVGRGMVFRIELEVLRLAREFGLQRISLEEYSNRLDGKRIRRSPRETAAFAAWSRGVVAEAKRIYHAEPKGRLKWTEAPAGSPGSSGSSAAPGGRS